MGEKKHGLRRVAGYLQIFYYAEFGKFIDFKNPKTFNEKLNWLKLYYRRPDLITLVDKYEVKKYIADNLTFDHIYDKFKKVFYDFD